jgi:LysM repeat protein
MRSWIAFCLWGLVSAGGLFAQSGNVTARVVGLEQDVAAMRREIGAMRLEMEALIRENQNLRQMLERQTSASQQQYVTVSQLQQTLKSLETEFSTKSNRQQDQMVTMMAEQINRLAEQTQTALNKLAESIGSRPQAPEVVTFTDNYPKNGINYTVRPGDSLGKIARENNSRVQWIRDANRLANDLIYPNQQLFVPQQD